MKIKKKWHILLASLLSFVIGVTLTYTVIRVSYLAANPHPHFHANFAVFIHGTRVDFSNDKYMEDIGSCSVANQTTPQERTHLHSNIPNVVHVHDNHVTWGDFLRNIRFTVTETSLITDTGTTYQKNGDNKMTFILNGNVISDPSNTFIKINDRLLISYGNESSSLLLQNQYSSVVSTADEYNGSHQDPASCKGNETPGFIFWK